jgi:hypothetical protein
MFASFHSMSPESRLWIFQSDRKFSAQDKTIITEHLKLFTDEWAAHGQPLKASFDLQYDQFLIIAVDEGYSSASGCSIDASVRVIKEIEKHIGINFLSRDQVAFLKNSTIELIPLKNLKEEYQKGSWNESTSTFNNVIATKSQLEKEWIVAAGATWLKRYVPAKTLAN